MAVPIESAEDGMGAAGLPEQIEGGRLVFWCAKQRIVKSDGHEALAIIAFWNCGSGVLWPDHWLRLGEFGFALVQIEVNLFAKKPDDRRKCRFEFSARDLAIIVGVEFSDFLQRQEIVGEFAGDLFCRNRDFAIAGVGIVREGGERDQE